MARGAAEAARVLALPRRARGAVFVEALLAASSVLACSWIYTYPPYRLLYETTLLLAGPASRRRDRPRDAEAVLTLQEASRVQHHIADFGL